MNSAVFFSECIRKFYIIYDWSMILSCLVYKNDDDAHCNNFCELVIVKYKSYKRKFAMIYILMRYQRNE